MNKEETTKIKVKLPLITNEDIKVLDNDFSYIVNEVIKTQCKERELALLQLIIKKQQALNEIREYIKSDKATVGYDEYGNIQYFRDECCADDILQIIDKVDLGDEK